MINRRKFALAQGFKKEKLLTAQSEKAWKAWLKTADYKPQINIENRSYRPDKQPRNQYTIGMLELIILFCTFNF